MATVKKSTAKPTTKSGTKSKTKTTTKKVVKAAPMKKKTTRSSLIAGPINFTPYKEKKGEEYMNEHQLEHFRNILNLWKQQFTTHELEATSAMPEDNLQNISDPIDRASEEERIAMAIQALDREQKFIKKIDEALHHIEQGDYGFCDVCGAEIGIRRLEARPTATQCIDCKTIDEMREKQTGTGSALMSS